MKEKLLFLCQTPYHLFLSRRYDSPNIDKYIFYVPDSSPVFSQDDLGEDLVYVDFSRRFFKPYFPFLRCVISRRVSRLRNLLRGVRIDSVVVFNDRSVVVQYAMHLLKRKGVKQFIYAEDGSAAYRIHKFDWTKIQRTLFSKLFGFPFECLRSMGTHSFFSEALALFPDQAQKFTQLPVRQFPVNPIMKADRDFVRGQIAVGGSWKKFDDPGVCFVLVLLSYSASGSSCEIVQRARKVASTRENCFVLVKAHPRMKGSKWFHDSVISVPSEIAAEDVPILYNVVEVFTEPSTSAISFLYFFPDIPQWVFIQDREKYTKKLGGYLTQFPLTHIYSLDEHL